MQPNKNQVTSLIRILLLSVFTILFFFISLSAKSNTPFLSGGMGVLLQYASVATDNGTAAGPAWGIGGRLHFYLGSHFRFGAMGSTWKLGYDSPGLKGSYYDIGYGGITAEYSWRFYSFRLSLGGMFGGGGITNLHVVSQGPDNYINAVYDTHPTMLFSPMVTFEHSLTKHMALMAMAEFLTGNRLGNNHMVGYPSLRLGFLFNR